MKNIDFIHPRDSQHAALPLRNIIKFSVLYIFLSSKRLYGVSTYDKNHPSILIYAMLRCTIHGAAFRGDEIIRRIIWPRERVHGFLLGTMLH